MLKFIKIIIPKKSSDIRIHKLCVYIKYTANISFGMCLFGRVEFAALWNTVFCIGS